MPGAKGTQAIIWTISGTDVYSVAGPVICNSVLWYIAYSVILFYLFLFTVRFWYKVSNSSDYIN